MHPIVAMFGQLMLNNRFCWIQLLVLSDKQLLFVSLFSAYIAATPAYNIKIQWNI